MGKLAEQGSRIDRENPFLGLQPFREHDQEFFYGRRDEADELFRRVRRHVLTVLFGASGLGKTSLLNAGLFPLLREDNMLPVPIRLAYGAQARLVKQVKASIQKEIDKRSVDARPPEEEETLWEYFHSVHFWSRRNRLLIPVLILDQFEEIFTLGQHHCEVDALREELADLIENQIPKIVTRRLQDSEEELPYSYDQPKIKVILSLREDFLPDLEELQAQIPSLSLNRLRLTQMTGEQAFAAAYKPAENLLTENVAQKIVRFVAGSTEEGKGDDAQTMPLSQLKVEPPLLSLVCRELNNTRRRKQLPKITSELLIGSRKRIIAEFYDRTLSKVNSGVSEFIENELLTASGYRNTAPREKAGNYRGVKQRDIDTLIKGRLLRQESRLGRPYVELIHDVLTPVVKENRERRKQREEIKEEFDKQRKDRMRKLKIAGVSVLACVAIALLVQIWRVDKERMRALGGKLAITAQYLLHQDGSGDPDLSALLATESLARSQDLETYKVWMDVMSRPHRHPITPGKVLNENTILSSDGSRWANNENGKLQIYDASTKAQVRTISLGKDNFTPVFSEDGTALVSAFVDYQDKSTAIRIWKVDAQSLPDRIVLEGFLTQAALNLDGSKLATVSQPVTGSSVVVTMWDVVNRERLWQQNEEAVSAMAFAPKGKMLAVANNHTISFKPVSRDPSDKSPADTWRWPSVVVPGPGGISSLAFRPDERWLAVGSEGAVYMWDLSTRSRLFTLLHLNSVRSIAFPGPGELLAIMSRGYGRGGGEDLIAAWDLYGGAHLKIMVSGVNVDDHVPFAALNHDASKLITVEKTVDGRMGMSVWVVSSKGEPDLVYLGMEGDARALSHDGKRLAIVHPDGENWAIEILDVETEKPMHSIKRQPFKFIALNNNGERLGIVFESKTEIYDLFQKQAFSIDTGNVKQAVFSYDGSRLVTIDSDRSLKVWDTRNGEQVSSAPFENDVNAIALSANNEYIATSSGARITIRELGSGSRIADITTYANVKTLAFDEFGSQLTTVSADGIVQVWPLPEYESLISHSCTRLTRKLTNEEWEKHVKGEKYEPVCESIHE